MSSSSVPNGELKRGGKSVVVSFSRTSFILDSRKPVKRITLSSTIEGTDDVFSYSHSDSVLKFVHSEVLLPDILSIDPENFIMVTLWNDGEDCIGEAAVGYRSLFSPGEPRSDCVGVFSAEGCFEVIPPRLAQLVGDDVELSPNLRTLTGHPQRLIEGCVVAPNLPKISQ